MEGNTATLVSVVIPVYNAASHLRETLESIFRQTYPAIEIVAVDDGSSDNSVEILLGYGNRVRLVQQPNSGPAVARNRGVAEASGEWIAFLDADDLWEPRKIEIQLKALNGCNWSYTDSVFMGGANDGKRDSELNEKLSGDVLDELICCNFIGTSSVLVRRDIFMEMNGFDPTLRSIQDWDLWMRIASQNPIAYINEPLVRYRVHATSTSRSTRKTLPNHLRVIDKIFSPQGVAAHKPHLKAVAKAKSMGICSQIAEEEGDYSFAVKCAIGALLQRPTQRNNAIRAAKITVKYALHRLGLYGARTRQLNK